MEETFSVRSSRGYITKTWRFKIVKIETLVSWDQGEFGNPEVRKRLPLEAATKQRLVKTEKPLCVL
jgi:hypothetical protein